MRAFLFRLLHNLIAHPLLVFGWDWTTQFHDWTALWAFKPEIVCVLHIKDGQILGVARRGTRDRWGLPGGKVEPGEDLDEAILRETFEETRAIPLGLKEFCRAYSQHQHKIVQVYIAREIFGTPSQGDAGAVGYITWDQLIAGPFGEFHKELRNRYFWKFKAPSVL